MSLTDSDVATEKFQTSFPALLGSMPQLAALHNSRLLQHHLRTVEDGPFNMCSQCGAFLHCPTRFENEAHQSTTRLYRTKCAQAGKQSTSDRVVKYTCGNCGWITKRVIENGNVALFPRRKRGQTRAPDINATIAPPIDIPRKKDQPISSTPPQSALKSVGKEAPPVAPSPPSQVSRSRPKKKSGLQEILARNREKEERQKQSASARNGQDSGLAAFLSGL